MFEIAVRIRELTSSNLNSLVGSATSPAKMLRLLQLELEEAIIALTGDHTRALRRSRDAAAQAAAQDAAAADWQDKAKLALAGGRDDLARGALGEKENAKAAAAALRTAAIDAEAEQAALAEAIAGLEAKLDETRTRLRAEQAKADPKSAPSPAAAKVNGRVDTLHDRIATLEKRIDFAAAGETSPAASAASLDSELAAMKREAAVDDELAALKKSMKKGK
ncbi:MAG: PspA/IM30 family protein [Novosphingobium sp.]|uniref:PspA/IM30 family protein n=1 Tax=Novosphingobium sp. TaxID=1874826 RepID=UPI003C79EEB3